MQQHSAKRQLIFTCIGLGLLAASSAAPAASKAEAALGDWYQYAMYQLAPEISMSLGVTTASDGQAALVRQKALLPVTSSSWLSNAFGERTLFRATLSQSTSLVGLQPGLRVAGAALGGGVDLNRSVTAPELTASFGSGSQLRVGAVFAQQQFLSDLGQQRIDLGNPLARSTVRSESSSGSAIRFGLDQELGSQASLALDYQSRVDMDAFQRLRGLYSEPGDFDVPATVSMGLNVNTGDRASVGVGVDRLLYSDVSAFTTNALPNRLLSLLGDSTSPRFEWRDLTVYRATVNVRTADDSALRVTYATRLQPVPNSAALRSALSQDSSARNVVVGFDQALGAGAAFSVAATYSPSQYFLGPRLGSSDGSGDLLEVQAVWRLEF